MSSFPLSIPSPLKVVRGAAVRPRHSLFLLPGRKSQVLRHSGGAKFASLALACLFHLHASVLPAVVGSVGRGMVTSNGKKETGALLVVETLQRRRSREKRIGKAL